MSRVPSNPAQVPNPSPATYPAELAHLFLSPGHNFVGHHEKPPGDHPMIEVSELRCVAGRGIEGDRFFDHKEDYKGQITFFEEETYRDVAQRLAATGRPPSVFRRNVITRGIRLETLIGREFELQGVRFLGTEECRPCHWMNLALAPGAEAMMRGRGGLRARILVSGTLRPGPCEVPRSA